MPNLTGTFTLILLHVANAYLYDLYDTKSATHKKSSFGLKGPYQIFGGKLIYFLKSLILWHTLKLMFLISKITNRSLRVLILCVKNL